MSSCELKVAPFWTLGLNCIAFIEILGEDLIFMSSSVLKVAPFLKF